MTVWIVTILLIGALGGILLLAHQGRNAPPGKLRTAAIAALGVLALGMLAYLALTALFVSVIP